MQLQMVTVAGYEQVVEWSSSKAGCRGIVAIHNTMLGPALGGCRLWHYRTSDEARIDVLRLSRGMTYKNALAGIPYGGGKAVILGPLRAEERQEAFREFGKVVDRLGGSYVTAEDVGTSPADMQAVSHETRHVAGLPGGSGDPSPWTALGVLHAIRVGVRCRLGANDLQGVRIGIQGCGHVGAELARLLYAEGARLTVADVDHERARQVAHEAHATIVTARDIVASEVDVLSPCALGGTISPESVSHIRASVVAGAANNQLTEPSCGETLHTRDILYLPDYVVNAGGVISIATAAQGGSLQQVYQQVAAIGGTINDLLHASANWRLPPFRAADEIVERKLRGEPIRPNVS